jgi:hypothetical protein
MYASMSTTIGKYIFHRIMALAGCKVQTSPDLPGINL